MPTRYLAITLLLFATGLTVHAERLTYNTTLGRMDYRYDIAITGQVRPPGGAPLPVVLQMGARVIDQVTGKAHRDLSPVTMSIKDIELSGSSGENEFGDDVENTVISFLRSRAGVMSKLQYLHTPSKADTLIPGMENIWLLFSRFGHHLRLPEQELRAGEKWTSAETLGLSTGKTMALRAESTLVGVKMVDGKRYVQIDSTFQLTAPKQRLSSADGTDSGLVMELGMSGKSFLLFDPRAGEVYRATITAQITTKTTMSAETSGTKNAMAGSFSVTTTAHRTSPPAPAGKKR